MDNKKDIFRYIDEETLEKCNKYADEYGFKIAMICGGYLNPKSCYLRKFKEKINNELDKKLKKYKN